MQDAKYPPLSLVEKWLERSTQAPVTIRLQLPQDFPSEHSAVYEYFLHLIPLLKRDMERWGSLTLVGGTRPALSALPTSLLSMTQLHKVDITTYLDCDDEAGDVLMDRLNTGTSLRHLQLRTYGDSSRLYLPNSTVLRNLTHINICVASSLTSILHVLRACTSVVHLQLTLCDGLNEDYDDDDDSSHVHLPQLRTLNIGFSNRPDYHFLDYVDAPDLSVLRLASTNKQIPQNFTSLHTFLRKVSKTLQILLLSGPRFPSTNVIQLFSTPQLYNIPVVEVFTDPNTDTQDVLVRKVTDVGKGRKLVVENSPHKRAPGCWMGWVDEVMYQKWRHTLDGWNVTLTTRNRWGVDGKCQRGGRN